jgi:hypothetical protein
MPGSNRDAAFQQSAAEDRRLPSFEAIVGFSEVPPKDVEAIKEKYVGPFVAQFVNETYRSHQEFLASIGKGEAPAAENPEEKVEVPDLMELVKAYFQERVYDPLFDALIAAVPEYQELKDNPLKLSELNTERSSRFAELYQRPDVASLLKNEYRPLQARAEQMLLELFDKISKEALAKAMAAALEKNSSA